MAKIAAKRKKGNNNNLLKFFILILLFLFILGLLVYVSKIVFNKFISTTVNMIEVKPVSMFVRQADLDFLKNKNIFDVDLKNASVYLSGKYPQFSQIRLYKRFPDTIIIELNQRTRFAQIKAGSNFCVVDRDFIIISKEPNSLTNLIEIRGVKPREAVSSGRHNRSRKEKIAAYLINFFEKNRQYPKIFCLDVSNLPDIKLFILNEIKVIIGVHEFDGKIKLLPYLMPKIKQDVGKIDYIDLRFKEPVINYKEK